MARMTKLTVLFVVPLPPPWAGVEEVSRVLSQSPLLSRYHVRVIKSNVRTTNTKKGSWDLEAMFRVGWLSARLALALVSFRPALVYTILSQNASGLIRDLLYLSISKAAGRRVVMHVHGSQLSRYLATRRPWIRNIILKTLRKADGFIVCAHWIKEDLLSYFPKEKVHVVYNSILTKETLESPGVPMRSFPLTVAFMGHLSAAKGFLDLAKAAQILLKKGLDVNFKFAGEKVAVERNIQLQSLNGAEKPTWELVERLRNTYPERFQLAGVFSNEKKFDFLKGADIFAFPSYAESFGLVALEAMAVGLPLVVTPVGALKEMLEPGTNCLFVPPGDPAAIAGAIEKLIADPALRQRMADQNKKKAREYPVDRFAEEISNVFESALSPYAEKN